MELTVIWATKIFLAFLFTRTLVQAYLDLRHQRHIWINRKQVPAPFDRSGGIGLEDHQKAVTYSMEKIKTGKVFRTVHLLILLAWTLAGGLELFTQWAAKANDLFPSLASPILEGLCLFILFSLVELLLNLPESIYYTFVIEAKFGFNRTTPKIFVIDLFKGLAVSAVIGLPFASLLLWLMMTFVGSWWWIGFICTTLFQVLLIWAYPTLIAPLFNKFTPLEEGETKAQIEDLLEKTKLPFKGLFVMDASKRTAHGNAYFTGFGKARRIVFFDTLLKSLSPAEMRAILAHEIGHYKKHHLIKGLLISIVSTFIGFYLLGVLAEWPTFFIAHGVKTITLGGTLLLFTLVAPVYTFFFVPLGNLISRKHEYEADQFAAQHADPEDLVNGLIKLYRENASTLTPDPVYSAFYYSHPPAVERARALLSKSSNHS
ncbi:MAG: peptidase M48 [Bdellovibrionales bacterium GWA2_49_15]|nr:MAG: peptidase M48 [Bdellovibrionales bacterium GWA2_49_15]HAZ14321.1 peptidase M48 [Bdellovibrionales bacterium]